ncbi:MAG: DUF1641 domain-containing protein, partial [Anaerolineales bacterium]|nr:DUF1641 domain-containing protein [Anaerolineales bacterium]
MTLLYEKIDLLTAQLEVQNQRLETIEAQGNGNGLMLEKLDYITRAYDEQRQRQEEFNELKNDLIPVANHMIKLSIDELAEIGTEFQAEDLLFLLKRLLRDTHLLVGLLNSLESTMELVDETSRIGQQVFNQAVMSLDRLEREGYFTFAQSGWRIVERIVNEFSEEDIDALGDNVVTILTTVRNLTQPEIMNLTNNAIQAIQDEPVSDGDISVWALVRDLNDPQVRKGMARLLNMLKVIADQPDINKN